MSDFHLTLWLVVSLSQSDSGADRRFQGQDADGNNFGELIAGHPEHVRPPQAIRPTVN
jgi:hypothetical protein